MSTLTTKYVDSAVLSALLTRIAKMYESLKNYTDTIVGDYITADDYNNAVITETEMDAVITTLDTTYSGFADATGVSTDSSSAESDAD